MSKSSILGAVSGVAFSILVFASGSLMVDPPGMTPVTADGMAPRTDAMRTAPAVAPDPAAPVASVTPETPPPGAGGAPVTPGPIAGGTEPLPAAQTAEAPPAVAQAAPATVAEPEAPPPATVASASEPVAAPGSEVPASTAVTLPVTDTPPAEADAAPAPATAIAPAEAAPKDMAGAPAKAPASAAAPPSPPPTIAADAVPATPPAADATAVIDKGADQPVVAEADQPVTAPADHPLANVSGAGMDGVHATDAPAADMGAADARTQNRAATDAPAMGTAANDAPVTDAPVTDAPVTDAPATDVPATDAPAAALPKVVTVPAVDAPAVPTAPGDPAKASDGQTAAATPPAVATLKIGNAAPSGPLVLAPGGKPATSDLPKVVTLVPPRADRLAPDAALPDGAAGAAPDGATAKPGLGREVAGVKVLRLGAGTTAAAPAAAAEVGAKAAAEAGPLKRYAASFTNPRNKPLLGILIFDEGVSQGGMDSAALASIPFPVTIAIDPEREGASSVAASYHAAGAEVAMLVGDLPDGSTASDVEVAYQSFTAALPNSVALVGRPGSGMVRGGLAAEHVAALLAADGRGLITYDAGLNDGRRAAQKAGLPNAVIEKVLGPSEDNDGTVARELDRAAFMANQKGASVVAITATPEAITSLVAWATGPDSASVALAPVSAVMMAKPK